MTAVLAPYWKRTLTRFIGLRVRLTRTDGAELEGVLVRLEEEMARVQVVVGPMPRAVRYETLRSVEAWP